MVERLRNHEQNFPEIFPDPRVVDALRGEISEPIKTISHKPGSEGKLVEVRLAKEGPGLFGLTDWRDSKEWSGITNHSLLTARYSVYFSQRMTKAGYETNPQRSLNGIIVSHAGRRQWDEAGWYPEAVEEAEVKRSISNETLGMRLIQGKVPQDAFELVVALGHNVEGFSVDPSIYESWDYKLAIYVDHRTAQKYEPLNTRMGDFLLGNFFQRSEITPEIKGRVYAAIGDMIERQKNYRLGKEGTKVVTLDEADQIAQNCGARPDSERLTRKELMRLILQDVDTEATLIREGIDPDNINDETVPMPKWEDDFRKVYVKAAQDDILEEVRSRIGRFRQYIFTDNIFDYPLLERLNEEFPLNTWWGQYARTIFYQWYDSDEQETNKRNEDSGYKLVDSILSEHFKRPFGSEREINQTELRFTIPPELEGLTPEMLTDLSDILNKWGYKYIDEGVLRFVYESSNIDSAILMSGPIISLSDHSVRMMIFRYHIAQHGMHIIGTEKGGRIFWDKDLSVEDAKKLIKEIDNMSREIGIIDPQTGVRKELPDSIRIKYNRLN